MKQIILNSRDGGNHILEQLEGNKYVLRTNLSYRMGIVNDTDYFIDPSGGPFMTKGTTINNCHIIEDIIIEDNMPQFIIKDYDLCSNTKSRAV